MLHQPALPFIPYYPKYAQWNVLPQKISSPALLFVPLPPTTRLVCLPAVAFAAYQWSLHLWNLLQMRGRSRLCLCVLSAFVCALTRPSPRPHAGVQTSTLERHLCNRAYVFRPFLLTVESQQLPCGTRVCCSVMKVLLISALGCSVHASQLENADINTYCPVARSRVGTNLTHRSLSGLLLTAADTRIFEMCVELLY